MLFGRDAECARVDRLIERARDGTAGALLVRGEPGIGKTALLDYAAERAGSDATLVRAVGIESEAELEFSALFDVCRPLLDRLDELSEGHRSALSAALGIGPDRSTARLSVGAATLSLLAAAAEQSPIVVLVDDAQWIDAASADALLFAGRRLVAERVAMLVATRADSGGAFERGCGLDTLSLAGVDSAAAAALLGGGDDVSPAVAGRINAATGGSPLALVELSSSLTAPQLLGAEPINDPLPVGPAVERAFAERARRLPEHVRRALLVAAVSSSERVEPVVDALGLLELELDSLDQAEDAGLLRVDGATVRFRHPLVRSAIVQGAAPSDRRRAHRALADALVGCSDEQRAHHLAAAAVGPDAQAADALAEVGRRTRARSGWASAALTLERSARLTPDAELRQARLVEAAELSWVAGRIEPTLALAEELLADEQQSAGRIETMRLRSQIELHCGGVGRALEHLLETAKLAERDQPEVAAVLFAEAVESAALLADRQTALDAAEGACGLAVESEPSECVVAFAHGQALRLAGRLQDAQEPLERALLLVTTVADLRRSMRANVRGAYAASWLGRVPDGLELATRATEFAREQSAFGPLAHTLAARADLAAACGRWREARAYASEALDLARETRCAWAATSCLERLAWLDAVEGGERRCRERADEAVAVAQRAGFDSERARRALALLALGTGAVDEAARAYDAVDTATLLDDGADLVEAWVRSDRLDDARAACEQLPARAGDPLIARCRALVAGDDDFDDRFHAALDQLPDHDPFGRARTQLAYGERLRRAGRRDDARDQLRAAHDGFEQLGARPWAERAGAELGATGEQLGRRPASDGDELTPQELQVTLLVAEGRTNKEVGAALFLSPKTVDFHLGRVFRKLGIRSRTELIRDFAASTR